jgi:hypothetical protein
MLFEPKKRLNPAFILPQIRKNFKQILQTKRPLPGESFHGIIFCPLRRKKEANFG